jgi:hypothetical protein
VADRHWVQVAGAYSGNFSDTNHWSALRDGAGGASVPSSSDNAIIDPAAPGSFTVTVDVASNCLDFDCSGSGGTLTLARTAQLNVFGSWTLKAGTLFSGSALINYAATASGKTVTMNGVAFSGGSVQFGGSGGGWTLQDAFDAGSAGDITVAQGTWDSNGKAVACRNFSTSGSPTATLGASTFTVTTWTVSATTTFSGASSTVNVTGTAGTPFVGGSKTYGTVSIQCGSAFANIQGANTFANLTLTNTASKSVVAAFNADQVVTGTLKYLGNSILNRLLIQSNVLGTPRIITAAAIDATSNFIDFQDITAAGAAAPFATGSSIGDCGGNTSITATAPVTQTATGTASFTWSTHGWTTRVPLPQDDVIVPNAFVAGRTITVDMPRLGRNVTFSCTGNPIYNQTAQASLFGNLQFASGMTSSGAQNLYFGKRGTATLQTSGVAIAQSIRSGQNVAGFGTTVKLLDALTTTNAVILVGAGNSFDDNGFSVAGVGFQLSASTASVVLGATWLLSGSGTVWNNGSAGSVTASGSALIQLTDATAAAKLFAGGGKTYNNIWFNNAGAGTFDLSGSNTFNDFKVDTGCSVRFTAGTTTTATSWSIAAGCTIGSITAASHTLAVAGGNQILVPSPTVSRSTVSPANKLVATGGTDNGNNSGWVFGSVGAAQGQSAGSTVVLGRTASPIADADFEFAVPRRTTQFRVPLNHRVSP